MPPNVNVGGDFRMGRKSRKSSKNMIFGCFRKSFTGQGRKIRKHLTSVSESLNIIKKKLQRDISRFRVEWTIFPPKLQKWSKKRDFSTIFKIFRPTRKSPPRFRYTTQRKMVKNQKIQKNLKSSQNFEIFARGSCESVH